MSHRTECVYLLRWPDDPTMREQWQGFMADEEWARIKCESNAAHGDLVGGISEKTMSLTGYSPGV